MKRIYTIGAYPDYYETYLASVSHLSLKEALKKTLHDFKILLKTTPESQGNYAYQSGKWTVKQLVQHLIDVERILSYRALAFSRRDWREMAGFDEDVYIQEADFSQKSLRTLVSELEHLRKSNILFFAALPEAVLQYEAVANAQQVSVRAIGYILAGHLAHHTEVLRSRYAMPPTFK